MTRAEGHLGVMREQQLALLYRYPELTRRLAHRAYLRRPTPVESLELAGFARRELFVKRDDLSCRLYGGNKPRKLEFLIGHALERGARRLVTVGGLGSHHGLATTILGRAAGLSTTLVLIDQPLTPEVRETLRLDAAWGAEVCYGRNLRGAGLRLAGALARSRARGERPYLVWVGGRSPRGNLGFVSAALELAEQVRAGLLPAPAEIAVAVGSGGSYAGLVVGLKLAGLAARVRGVLATDVLAPTPRSLVRSARATLRLLRRLSPRVPALPIGPEDFPLDRAHVGPGYGVATGEAREALAAAAECGLTLDTTYTAKCLAALIARQARGELPDGPVLFWNTFGAVAAAPPPAAPGIEQLPASLRERLVLAHGQAPSYSRSTSTRVSRSTWLGS